MRLPGKHPALAGFGPTFASIRESHVIPGRAGRIGMKLLGLGCVGVVRLGTRLPSTIRKALKSPVFSAAVGTFAESTWPRRSRRHSSDQKKNTRFLTMGPLKFPPKL